MRRVELQLRAPSTTLEGYDGLDDGEPLLENPLVPYWDHDTLKRMRIIALSTLKLFLDKDPAYGDARQPVMAWYRQARTANWATPADIKRDIRSASILKDGRVIFNIAGNKYRIVAWINFPYRVVYIRFVGTHEQYDDIDAQTV